MGHCLLSNNTGNVSHSPVLVRRCRGVPGLRDPDHPRDLLLGQYL